MAVLAKVKNPLRRYSEMYLRHFFRPKVAKNQLSLARDLTTSAGLCGKVREKAKKTDLSEKKLV